MVTTTLQGKVAVITGSARNIGRACAIELAKRGAKVVVNARTRDKVTEVVGEIQAIGGEALPNYDSVGTSEGAKRIIQTAVEGFGSLDILVNNAAIMYFGRLHEMPDEEWEEVINVDLISPFRLCKEALPYMMSKGWGRIINVSAHPGLNGAYFRSSYAAAKGGINALTKSLAKEYGAYGITANAIAPLVKTEMETGPSARAGTIYSETFPPDLMRLDPGYTGATKPIPKEGSPEEVATAVAFFASEEAWFITGQVISVGGGFWM